MPRLYKKWICIILSSTLLFLGGCWNRREIETLAFVTATGIDGAAEPKKVQVTVQIAKPATLVATAMGGVATERSFWLVSSTGYTTFEAIRNFAHQSSRRLYWAHSQWLVFGEELARRGIEDVLDIFFRDGETRQTAKLAIFKGGKASDFLQTELEMERLSSGAYLGILQTGTGAQSTVVDVDLRQFLIALAGEGIEPVAIRAESIDRPPDVDIRGQMERTTISRAPRITGAAVFKGPKLVGWFDQPETRGYNWITGKVKSGIIIVERPEASDKYVGLELMRARSKLKPEIVEGRPSATVIVEAEANVGDIQAMFEVTDTTRMMSAMERRMATVIVNEIKAAVDKAQRELKSDVFGFGQAIYQEYPKEWRRLREDWNDRGFPELEVKTEVTVKLHKTGLTEIGLPMRR